MRRRGTKKARREEGKSKTKRGNRKQRWQRGSNCRQRRKRLPSKVITRESSVPNRHNPNLFFALDIRIMATHDMANIKERTTPIALTAKKINK